MTYDHLSGLNYGCKLRIICNLSVTLQLRPFQILLGILYSHFKKDMVAHFKYLNSNNTEEEVTYSMLPREQGQNQLVKNYKEADSG